MANDLELTREPFFGSPVARWLSDLDDLFDEPFAPAARSLFRRALTSGDGARFGVPELACELRESDDKYCIAIDMPGLDRKDIDLDVTGNVLRISADRREERTSGKGKRRRTEVRYGAYQRSFSLPADVDPEQIDASYQDGVLQVTLPKTAETKGKRIEVKGGDGGQKKGTLEGKGKAEEGKAKH